MSPCNSASRHVDTNGNLVYVGCELTGEHSVHRCEGGTNEKFGVTWEALEWTTGLDS